MEAERFSILGKGGAPGGHAAGRGRRWRAEALAILLAAAASLTFAMGAEAAQSPGVERHTPAQVRAFCKKHPVDLDAPVKFKSQPSAKKPYKMGELSKPTQEDALRLLQQLRYIAGLSADVEVGEEEAEMAQAAALVSAANGGIDHQPRRPAGMDGAMYKLGKMGCGSSNLSMGYKSITSAVLGCMDDNADANLERVGHRRWLLSPKLQYVGFGMADAAVATRVFDESGDGGEAGVAWPAQSMPVDYFSNRNPWTFETGEEEEKADVAVKVVREGDKRTWVFSKKKADGYFNVENGYYGMRGCIIFRPDGIEVVPGDKYDVTVSGTGDGTYRYKVKFFKL